MFENRSRVDSMTNSNLFSEFLSHHWIGTLKIENVLIFMFYVYLPNRQKKTLNI